MRPSLLPLAATVAIGLSAFGFACSGNGSPAALPSPTADAADIAGSPTPSPEVAFSNELTPAEIVRLLEPSVVRISTNSGVGTGFVVDSDGYIITNRHVIVDRLGQVATAITVTFNDGAAYTATVVGADERTDLAVLLVPVTGLQAVQLGSLAETYVGQDVVALGYALDLRGGEATTFTVTRGIISAKNRGISETFSGILGSIQTDAAINHGNSGGPLVNLYGEVIGVNTSLAPDPTTGGVAQGIGFAVGVDTVKAVFEEVLESGSVNRGFLGIGAFEALRPAKARELGVPDSQGGIVVGQVTAGGPSDLAGMLAGDVIVSIDGMAIATEADLAVALIRTNSGDTVDVEIYRGAELQTLRITLGTFPA